MASQNLTEHSSESLLSLPLLSSCSSELIASNSQAIEVLTKTMSRLSATSQSSSHPSTTKSQQANSMSFKDAIKPTTVDYILALCIGIAKPNLERKRMLAYFQGLPDSPDAISSGNWVKIVNGEIVYLRDPSILALSTFTSSSTSTHSRRASDASSRYSVLSMTSNVQQNSASQDSNPSPKIPNIQQNSATQKAHLMLSSGLFRIDRETSKTLVFEMAETHRRDQYIKKRYPVLPARPGPHPWQAPIFHRRPTAAKKAEMKRRLTKPPVCGPVTAKEGSGSAIENDTENYWEDAQ